MNQVSNQSYRCIDYTYRHKCLPLCRNNVLLHLRQILYFSLQYIHLITLVPGYFTDYMLGQTPLIISWPSLIYTVRVISACTMCPFIIGVRNINKTQNKNADVTEQNNPVNL